MYSVDYFSRELPFLKEVNCSYISSAVPREKAGNQKKGDALLSYRQLYIGISLHEAAFVSFSNLNCVCGGKNCRDLYSYKQLFVFYDSISSPLKCGRSAWLGFTVPMALCRATEPSRRKLFKFHGRIKCMHIYTPS